MQTVNQPGSQNSDENDKNSDIIGGSPALKPVDYNRQRMECLSSQRSDLLLQVSSSASTLEFDPVATWGKPLGLPTPIPPEETQNTINASTTTAHVKDTNTTSSPGGRTGSRKGKGTPKRSPPPVYVDLAYVPHHGNPDYSGVEYFKQIRARNYVFSGIEPSMKVFDALLEAKMQWEGEDNNLDVTIIPTYDSEALGTWVANHEEILALNRIDLTPSASRCTINLQDYDSSCSAYRLEF